MNCGEMEIKKFNSTEEYYEWLSWQSSHVKAKSQKFHSIHGDVIPVVIVLDCDTYGEGGGVHIFIHPSSLEYVLENVVFEADNC